MANQPDLFPEQPRVETVDPDEVRAELIDLLALARAAIDAAPWDRRTQRFHRVVFPQMARWLPQDEAAQLCFEFLRELDRIEELLAA
jgi:DNA transposition AAA+ family ATPase